MADQGARRIPLTVVGDPADDLEVRLEQFATVCRGKRGVRTTLRGSAVTLSVDPARIEAVGPIIEAAASFARVHVVLDDLGARLPASDLDGRPSGVWAAIGDAVDADDVQRSRDEAPTGDLYRLLSVVELDGVDVVLDARPPRVDAVGGGPPDGFGLGPDKFDDVDWHEGSAAEADQPREHAFTHIGVFLTWLIRHDLHDPTFFPRAHIQAVRDGSMNGSDLADDVDWKLVSDTLNADGAAFAAARYDRYMAEYDALLGDDVVYHVPEDDDLQARVMPVIDRLFDEWVAAGRPEPLPKEPTPLDAEIGAAIEAAAIPWEDIGRNANGPVGVQINLDGTYEVIKIEEPHEAPDLEALIPSDVIPTPVVTSSSTASHWGSSLLDRALKGLGVRPRDARVASALGGGGERTMSIDVYHVPGTTHEQLHTAFADVIHRPRRSSWAERSIGGTTVSWAEGPDGPESFNMAYWTRDELVFWLSGAPADMEAVIRAFVGREAKPK